MLTPLMFLSSELICISQLNLSWKYFIRIEKKHANNAGNDLPQSQFLVNSLFFSFRAHMGHNPDCDTASSSPISVY